MLLSIGLRAISLRVLALVFFVALLGFAWLQVNDPDPVLWTGYYLLCALVPLLVMFKRFYAPLLWVCVAITLVVAAIYIPGTLMYLQHMNEEPLMQSMNPQKPYIEETREFIGAAITLGLLLGSRLLYVWLK